MTPMPQLLPDVLDAAQPNAVAGMPSAAAQSPLGAFPSTTQERISRAQWVDAWMDKAFQASRAMAAKSREMASATRASDWRQEHSARHEWALGKLLVDSLGPLNARDHSPSAAQKDLLGGLIALVGVMDDQEWQTQAWVGETLAAWINDLKIWQNSESNAAFLKGLSEERADRFAQVLVQAHGHFSFFSPLAVGPQPILTQTPPALTDRSAIFQLGQRLGSSGVAAIRRFEPELFEGDNLLAFLSLRIAREDFSLVNAALGDKPAPADGVLGLPLAPRAEAWQDTNHVPKPARPPAIPELDENGQPTGRKVKSRDAIRRPMGLWAAMAFQGLASGEPSMRRRTADFFADRVRTHPETLRAIAADANLAHALLDCELFGLIDSDESFEPFFMRAFPIELRRRPAAWAWGLLSAHFEPAMKKQAAMEASRASRGYGGINMRDADDDRRLWRAAALTLEAIDWDMDSEPRPRAPRCMLVEWATQLSSWKSASFICSALRSIDAQMPMDVREGVEIAWTRLSAWPLDQTDSLSALSEIVLLLLSQGFLSSCQAARRFQAIVNSAAATEFSRGGASHGVSAAKLAAALESAFLAQTIAQVATEQARAAGIEEPLPSAPSPSTRRL